MDAEDTLPPARRETDLPADAPWWAKWLAANWNEAWKWVSVQFPLAVAAAAEVYAADPAGVKDLVQGVVPANWWPHLIAAGCFFQVALRMVRQTKPKGQ